jgi:hypothetical protein
VLRLPTGALQARAGIVEGFGTIRWENCHGGRFSNFNGSSCNRLARLNADGSLDTSFLLV